MNQIGQNSQIMDQRLLNVRNNRNKSYIWKYGQKLEKNNSNLSGISKISIYYKCRVQQCDFECLFAGTSNIMKHLANEHQIYKPLDDEASTTSSRNSDSEYEPQQEAQTQNNKFSQTKTSIANEMLLNCIISNFLPFSFVDNFYFERFFKTLNHNYRMPSSQTMSNSLLNQRYQHVIKEIIGQLEPVEKLSATTDCWTSCQNVSYLGLTFHWINEFWELISQTITVKYVTGRHTGEKLAEILTETFNSWNAFDKLLAMTTDCATNMISATSYYEDLFHVFCFGHILNLIVKKITLYKLTNHTVLSRSFASFTINSQNHSQSYNNADIEGDENSESGSLPFE